MQLVPFGCQEQKALASVVNADFLINIALVDEFTQNARARNRVFVKWYLDLK